MKKRSEKYMKALEDFAFQTRTEKLIIEKIENKYEELSRLKYVDCFNKLFVFKGEIIGKFNQSTVKKFLIRWFPEGMLVLLFFLFFFLLCFVLFCFVLFFVYES